jgi:ribA/ribD-fused uncharacterized protein
MELYTDGSCITGPDGVRYGGAGVWFGQDDPRNTHVPIHPDLSTNQYAELLAIHYALIFCRNVKSLVISTDSNYSIGCLTTWYKRWQENGWKTSTNKSVMHSEVIKDCVSIINYRESQGYDTSFKHVKGHSGVAGNEGADILARQASSKSCERAMDDTIFFSGGIFSQFFTSKFKSSVEDGEIEYSHAEQWHQHQKAILFGDHECAQRVLSSSLPWEQKSVGQHVKDFDRETWKVKGFEIAVKGNYYKFTQNPSLGRYLLSTKGKRLVEARNDSVWGIGITVSEAKSGVKWNGLNLLGKALMKVRDEML